MRTPDARDTAFCSRRAFFLPRPRMPRSRCRRAPTSKKRSPPSATAPRYGSTTTASRCPRSGNRPGRRRHCYALPRRSWSMPGGSATATLSAPDPPTAAAIHAGSSPLFSAVAIPKVAGPATVTDPQERKLRSPIRARKPRWLGPEELHGPAEKASGLSQDQTRSATFQSAASSRRPSMRCGSDATICNVVQQVTRSRRFGSGGGAGCSSTILWCSSRESWRQNARNTRCKSSSRCVWPARRRRPISRNVKTDRGRTIQRGSSD